MYLLTVARWMSSVADEVRYFAESVIAALVELPFSLVAPLVGTFLMLAFLTAA